MSSMSAIILTLKPVFFLWRSMIFFPAQTESHSLTLGSLPPWHDEFAGMLLLLLLSIAIFRRAANPREPQTNDVKCPENNFGAR